MQSCAFSWKTRTVSKLAWIPTTRTWSWDRPSWATSSATSGRCAAATCFPCELALLDRLETLAFELEAVDASGGQTRVRMQPSNLLLSAVIDPVVFTFESDTGKLVRLEGRVPPKRRDGEWLEDFDARVEYSFVAAEYL